MSDEVQIKRVRVAEHPSVVANCSQSEEPTSVAILGTLGNEEFAIPLSTPEEFFFFLEQMWEAASYVWPAETDYFKELGAVDSEIQ